MYADICIALYWSLPSSLSNWIRAASNNSDYVFKWKTLFPLVDLQFSTDDEEFEEVVADFDTTAAVLGQGEALARSAQPINYLPGKETTNLNNIFHV